MIIGYLSWNPTLDDVALTRQTRPVYYPIDTTIDPDNYECLIAVPYDYGYLIGSEVFIRSGGVIYGPYLVVDVQAYHHYLNPALRMENNHLAADINCPAMVHKKAEVISILW